MPHVLRHNTHCLLSQASGQRLSDLRSPFRLPERCEKRKEVLPFARGDILQEN